MEDKKSVSFWEANVMFVATCVFIGGLFFLFGERVHQHFNKLDQKIEATCGGK